MIQSIRKTFSLFTLLFLAVFMNNHAKGQGATSAYNNDIIINEDSLTKLMHRYSFERFYVEPNFPTKFLDKKTKAYGVPDEEKIVGYIDASLGGNCKYGIAIGLKGLYLCNSGSCSSEGTKFISYYKFKNNDLGIHLKNEFQIEFTGIDVIGLSKAEKAKAAELIKQIKYKFLRS